MKFEIDITNEMETAITKVVERHLEITSILPYIKDVIKREIKTQFDKRLSDYKQVIGGLNGRITNLNNKLDKLNTKIEEMENEK